MKPLKIAVLGTGFCGLACACILSEYVEKGINLHITLFDPEEIAANASGISAGLLHVYGGAQAKLSKEGIEGLSSTLSLLETVQRKTEPSIAVKSCLLRVAVSDQQKRDFFACAQQFSDVKWCEAEECQDIFPGMVPEPGILIKNAYAVDSRKYLEGLKNYTINRGALWYKRRVLSLKELSNFDAVIVAMGAYTASLPELSHLPIRRIKGQILRLNWPKNIPSLQFPISSRAYFVPDKDGTSCTVGATYERNFHNLEPDLGKALEYLQPLMKGIFRDLSAVDVAECYSGCRASTPNHMPLLTRESKNTWVITGMGSKGLLYHALYSKRLVNDVIRTLLPSHSL
jgi:glycine/D-amino acid oxidase-like deaminating enzyme